MVGALAPCLVSPACYNIVLLSANSVPGHMMEMTRITSTPRPASARAPLPGYGRLRNFFTAALFPPAPV